ncbi:TetR/AcrR family transcriptional regulator [Blastococcus sp. SYSU D00695]
MTTTGTPAASSGAATRAAIAASARDMFDERGFTATSVRAIAAAAGVDPALVIRHFGSKEQLFIEVMGLASGHGPALDGPLETLGAALVAYVLHPDRERERRAYATMVRASEHDAVRASLRASARVQFIDRLTARLEGPDAGVRAELIAAQVGGLMQAWPTISESVLDQAGRERVVALYARAVQALVDAPD